MPEPFPGKPSIGWRPMRNFGGGNMKKEFKSSKSIGDGSSHVGK